MTTQPEVKHSANGLTAGPVPVLIDTVRELGIILFAVGIIATLIGGAKVPAETGGWPDTLGIFGLGVVCSVLGLFLWHRSRRAQIAADTSSSSTATKGDPIALLVEVQAPLKQLATDIVSLEEDSITERVDEILEGWILPFSEVRQRLVDRLGMEQAADILVVVAYGERMLNRTWSAAGDRHLPESRSSFVEAHDALMEAGRLAGWSPDESAPVSTQDSAEQATMDV
jgi:hypothetical protein